MFNVACFLGSWASRELNCEAGALFQSAGRRRAGVALWRAAKAEGPTHSKTLARWATVRSVLNQFLEFGVVGKAFDQFFDFLGLRLVG